MEVTITIAQLCAGVLAVAAGIKTIGAACDYVAEKLLKIRRPAKERAALLALHDTQLKNIREELSEQGRRLNENDTLTDGIRTSNLALLHDRLYQVCRFYLAQGWIDVEGLKNVKVLYDSYHSLGGNGTGTILYDKVLEVPVKEEKQ